MNKITYENDPERQEKEVIPGTSDIAFKSIFKRNRELLIELVTGIEDSITKEEMKNFKFMSEEFPKESMEERGKKEGIEIGKENERTIIVNNMIDSGFSNEDIVKATGLNVKEIEKLRKENYKS